ncbi:MAG: biopolymer transporter ExbB [Rhodobacteraceae bacterium]|nr:biopolymer transporter ExbB [Paracoccaceae bacterium]
MKLILDTKHEPEFSLPKRQTLTMLIILALVMVGAFFAYPSMAQIFVVSPYLNGVILAVFVIGVLACFWQVYTLISSVSWIKGFAIDRPGHEFVHAPRLLASLSALLSDKNARKSLTSTSTRSILDSVGTRLDELRDVTRYISNLLIFLGLLGTFYGLATTVPAVVDTIRSLAPQEGQTATEVFANLMSGLEDQLGGMGTAFASSLLGLAGSLVVGMLELFASHGQNRFYMELEEWLSSITKIGLVSNDDDTGGNDTSALYGFMEQTAQQIETLKDVTLRGEESRQKTDASLTALSRSISDMTHSIANRSGGGGGFDDEVFERIAQNQEAMTQILQSREEVAGLLDSEARSRLRNIDVQLLRILEEMSAGRQDSIAELRGDLATLSQNILALANKRQG